MISRMGVDASTKRTNAVVVMPNGRRRTIHTCGSGGFRAKTRMNVAR